MKREDFETNEMVKTEGKNSKRDSKGRRSSTGKRRKSKNQKKSSEDKRAKSSNDSDNDISWYSNNPVILKSAANLSYYTPLGDSGNALSHYDVTGNVDYPSIDTRAGRVAGILTVEYIHGPATDSALDTEAIDIAANNLYAFVRHQNSGAKNYDAPDLMMYILAMDELYQAWAMGARAYGAMRLYSQTNRYLPRALVTAMGFNFDDLQGNMANFCTQMNVIAAQISAFCVPANLSYLRRHFWLPTNIYVDEDVTKPQMYIHRPALYRVWSDTFSDQGSMLVPSWWKYHEEDNLDAVNQFGMKTRTKSTGSDNLTEKLLTSAEYFAVLNHMLEQLNGSSDVGLISGDIKKAYGDGNLFTISPLSQDYVIMPVKNEEVLTQISNVVTANGFNYYADAADFAGTLGISQVVGTESQIPQIIYRPASTSRIARGNALPKILNFHKSEVTPEDTMIASRWLYVSSSSQQGTGYRYELSSVGSEFCNQLIITSLWADNANGRIDTIDQRIFASTMSQELLYSLIEQFDWHMPLCKCVWKTEEGQGFPNQLLDYIVDFANYTYVPRQVISNLNQAAILSMFDVPQLGSF